MPHSILRLFSILLITSSCLLAACAKKTVSLEVVAFTGLISGPEFRTARTTLSSANGDVVIDTSEALARFGVDYAHGRRVALFALAPGEYRVKVSLLRPDGSFLVDRVVALTLSNDTVLPVHLTRDCVGVMCPMPGGAPELSTCLQGQCVDPRCTESTSEYCPTVRFCDDASDCNPVAECAERTCNEGVCIPSVLVDSCEDNAWCNPEPGAGCQPYIPGPVETSMCGTICTMPDQPCRFGYWHCNEGDDPFCDDLAMRPYGYACEAGRICDESANCVTPMMMMNMPGIVVTPTSGLTTSEAGGTASFAMTLRSRPSANVTVFMSSADPSEATVSPNFLTFTPDTFATAQSVTVSGVDDSEDDGDQSFTITTSASASSDPHYQALDVDDVNGTNSDDDTAALIITPTTGLITTEGGMTSTFTVALATRPIATVNVSLSSLDLSEGTVAPSTLAFTTTNWSTPRTVTVTGVNDLIQDGSQDYEVSVDVSSSSDAAYAALAPVRVGATNTDDDTPGITVTPISGLMSSETGAAATFSIVLNTQPSANVVITLSSSDSSEGTLSPSSLTFTTSNWGVPRVVVVSGVDDPVDDGNVPYSVITSSATSTDPLYDGFEVPDVSVINVDNDIASVTVSPTSGLVTSELGGTAMFSVVLTAQPMADVTISLTSTNTMAGTVAVPSLTFTDATWNVEQTVTVSGVNDHIRNGNVSYSIITGATASSDPVYSGLSVADVSITNSAAPPYTQQAFVKESVLGESDLFGYNIALSSDGNTLAVAAPYEDGSATGIDGDATNNSVTESGAVIVFVRTGSTWTQQAYIKPSNTDAGDFFGWSLALSSDGSTLVVGSHFEASSVAGINSGGGADNSMARAGAAYVFSRTGATWSQQAYVKASNPGPMDQFSMVVAVSGDGNTFAASSVYEDSNATGSNGDQSNNAATESGAVYIFTRSAGVWSQQTYLKATPTTSFNFFGLGLAFSYDGNTLAVGDWNGIFVSGRVTVYTRAGTEWTPQASITASNAEYTDSFAQAISLSADGNTLAVGAYAEDSCATNVGGNQIDNSCSDAGAVYTFARTLGVWAQTAYIKAFNSDAIDRFGEDISLSGDGLVLAVGALAEDSARISLGGGLLDNSTQDSGAVYTYIFVDGAWRPEAYLKAADARLFDNFGTGVALSGDGSTLAVGAPHESSDATGINGDMDNVGATSSGAVYVYVVP